MTAHRRLLLVQGIVSVAALAGVVFWILHQHLPPLPDGAQVAGYSIIAIGVYALATLGRGERWHRLVELTGARSRRQDAYALTTIGYMGNNTMPARAGDLLKTALTASRTRTPYRDVLGAAVAERVLDAVTLGGVFAVLGGIVLRSAGLPGLGTIAIVFAAAAVLAFAAYLFLRSRPEHPHLARLAHFVRALARPSRALLSPEGALLLAGSLAIWACEATVYGLLGDALNLGLTPLDALYLVALTNLVALIPAAPGYVGTFDAAVLFGVKALTHASAASYAVLLRLVLFGPITLVGFVLLVSRYGGLSRLRTMRSQEATA